MGNKTSSETKLEFYTETDRTETNNGNSKTSFENEPGSLIQAIPAHKGTIQTRTEDSNFGYIIDSSVGRENHPKRHYIQYTGTNTTMTTISTNRNPKSQETSLPTTVARKRLKFQIRFHNGYTVSQLKESSSIHISLPNVFMFY